MSCLALSIEMVPQPTPGKGLALSGIYDWPGPNLLSAVLAPGFQRRYFIASLQLDVDPGWTNHVRNPIGVTLIRGWPERAAVILSV